MTIGISELQKNISIFKNITETVQVVDKKTKEVLALVLPKSAIEKRALTDVLGGILHTDKTVQVYKNVDEMVADAYAQEMKEKYGE